MHTIQKVYVAGCLTVVLWASGFIGIQIALESYSPVQIAFLRFLIASILLLSVSAIRPFMLPDKRDLGRILLMGGTGIALYNISLNYGTQFVSSGTASFIVNTAPIFSMILSALILKERMQVNQLIGALIAFAGIGIIAIGGGHVAMPASWVLLLAPISQSVFFVLQRPLLRRYPAFELICFSIWQGTICMLPFGLDVLYALFNASILANASIFYLGIFPSIFGYLCWAYVLTNMSVAKATNFLYLIPVITVICAKFIMGDAISCVSVLGGFFVLAGVVTARYETHNK